VFVRHSLTKDFAWAISLFHWAGVQLPTVPLPPQKWPLKCVPISWPSSQARRTFFSVDLMWSSVR
jgi:hypothetical protein